MNPAYAYDQPPRLEERKPYSFSPLQGPDFLKAFVSARDAALRAIDADQLEVSGQVDRYSSVSRSPARPDSVAGRCAALSSLRQKWESMSPGRLRSAGQLLEELIEGLAPRPDQLAGFAEESQWARERITLLLRRFEAFGCVHSEYDHRWRRRKSDPNPPEVVVRLALLCAWLAWVDSPLHRDRSVAEVNACLKLLDLASAGVRFGGWILSAADRARLAAAIHLERRLVESLEARVAGGGI